MSGGDLAPWLARWNLRPDGEAFSTHSSDLRPVLWQGRPAMLKVARAADEAEGGRLMAWWNGEGAAEVLASEPPALVLERGGGAGALRARVAAGDDDGVTALLCGVAARLHAPRPAPPPPLVPLEAWFQPLLERRWEDPLLAAAAEAARALLESTEVRLPLHGDLHHDNVLDFGPRGWLAIDPKGLLGDPVFDYANLLVNPLEPLALRPERLARQAAVIAEVAGLSRPRLLRWTLAFTGLSSVWILQDGAAAGQKELAHDQAVGALAAVELAKG